VLCVKQVAELQQNTTQNAPKLTILRPEINFFLGRGCIGGNTPPHTLPLRRLNPRAYGARPPPTALCTSKLTLSKALLRPVIRDSSTEVHAPLQFHQHFLWPLGVFPANTNKLNFTRS